MEPIQHGVVATLRQQFLMWTALNQLAFFQHENAISHADSREAVRDQQRRATSGGLLKAAKEFILSTGIEAGARFIKDEQPRIGAGNPAGEG